MSPHATQESPSVIWPKIERAHIGMFTTRDEYGHLISHPMTNQQIDQEGVLWFFASDQSHIAHNISLNPEVNVSFVRHDENLYVSVSGQAEEVKDRALIRKMWSPLIGAWFPEGEDDPHICLIKVVVHAAEYWDAEANKMLQLFKLAKALVVGNAPSAEPSAHGRVVLN
ncbi:MAG TPA: pyridoxamine 5'-phosphate oxidase family protein [Methylophilaceae bacterium]|nr:pyridoxamine 5'-phosphate oxidase family protein [Methylophilaceae bacterium]